MNIIRRKIKNVRNNKIELLEIKIIVYEMKTLLDGIDNRLIVKRKG